MDMIFLDTNTIVYLSKNMLDLDLILSDEDDVSISIINYMEVLGYAFESKEEEFVTKQILLNFKTIYIDQLIVNKVIDLRKKYKIKLPDAIICATVIIADGVLITNDVRLERIKELNIKLLNI